MSVARVYSDGGHIRMANAADHEIWSTERRPVMLLPDEFAIVKTGFNIEFPEFQKRFHYGYARRNNNAQEMAVSILALRPGTYDFPDIDLGALPAGINYLDVRVNLTRTVNPVPMGVVPIPSELPAGKTCHLPGGACEIEKFLNYNRMFWIEPVGGQAILKRRQTVMALFPPYVPHFTTDYLANAFSTGGGDLDYRSPPRQIMGDTGWAPNVDNARRRGGPQAVTTNTSAFQTRSVYTGTITIRPGVIDCVGPGCAVNGGRSLQVTRQPASGWNYQNTPGNYTRWQSRTLTTGVPVGSIIWGNQYVATDCIGPSDTEFYSRDGWIYMRGPLAESFPGNDNLYRIARRRETVIT